MYAKTVAHYLNHHNRTAFGVESVVKTYYFFCCDILILCLLLAL